MHLKFRRLCFQKTWFIGITVIYEVAKVLITIELHWKFWWSVCSCSLNLTFVKNLQKPFSMRDVTRGIIHLVNTKFFLPILLIMAWNIGQSLNGDLDVWIVSTWVLALKSWNKPFVGILANLVTAKLDPSHYSQVLLSVLTYHFQQADLQCQNRNTDS